jgi:mono/diheme cytochrome c family protein
MEFSEKLTISMKSTDAISKEGWGDEAPEVVVTGVVSSPNSTIFRPAPLWLDTAEATWHDHHMQSWFVPPKRRLAGLWFLAALVFTSGTPSVMTAQATPHRTVWDGAYTEAQAARGLPAFGQNCGGCHALTAEGKAPLVGDAFWKSFAQKTVGDLLEFVSANMPNATPGSLDETTYRDIVALMLKSNGFPAGTTDLGRDTSANVQIVQKNGGGELPANALARVVGCLTRSGADWAVSKATTPERAERAVPGGEDASRPLGSRTIPLKFVVTRLDPLAGSRVVVNGLLIGVGGADGINVTTVSRVAEKCP